MEGSGTRFVGRLEGGDLLAIVSHHHLLLGGDDCVAPSPNGEVSGVTIRKVERVGAGGGGEGGGRDTVETFDKVQGSHKAGSRFTQQVQGSQERIQCFSTCLQGVYGILMYVYVNRCYTSHGVPPRSLHLAHCT